MELQEILNGALTILIGLVVYIWKTQSNKIDSLEKNQDNIKTNYLSRFEKLNDSVHEVKLIAVQSNQKLDDLILTLNKHIEREHND